jgi:titin
LNWDDNSDNEDSFRIERRDSGAWTSPGSVVTDVKTFTDTSTSCGYDYQYRVWAHNVSGDSPTPSNTALVSTLPCPPDGLTLTPRSQIRINLGWNDTSHNEDGFRIERSLNATPRSWTGWNVGANMTSYSDDSLECNTTYVFQVWAYKNGLDSISSSGEVSDKTQACGIPPVPADAIANPRTRISIRISWTDIDGETSYEVERWNGAGWDLVGPSLPKNSTTFIDKGLAIDTSYTYRIRSHNIYGFSAYVDIPSARTYKLAFFMPFMLKK